MKYKILATILMISIFNAAFADESGDKKKVKHKPKPHITKPKKVEVKTTPKPKLPSLLETKYDVAVTPNLKPILPLLDIPIVPTQIQPLVETEVRTFEFEHKNRKGLFLLLGGAIAGTAIAILLHDNDKEIIPVVVPTPTPQNTPVPESKSLILFGLGIAIFGFLFRKEII